MPHNLKLHPIRDRVILKRLESQTISPGGIVIPDIAKEKPMKGEVMAVGEGRMLDTGENLPPSIKPGDHVLFSKHAGSEFILDDIEYVAVQEDEIISVIHDA